MKQVFDLSAEEFHAHLLQTVSAHKQYKISFQNTDHQRFTIFYPAKAIVIDGHAVSNDGTTELCLSATSPICVISTAYEQQLLADLLVQLQNTIHSPVRPATVLVPRYSLSLNRLIGLATIKP